MSQFNSPLCAITWTEVVSSEQRFAFQRRDPLELRFGLEIDEHFWSSFDSSLFFIYFLVFGGGVLRRKFDESGVTAQLPGAPSEQLWLGMSVGTAAQATAGRSGLFAFRPEIWFMRFRHGGYIPGEFAVAREDHWFAVEIGGPGDGSELEFSRLVGGSGRPNGDS